MVFLPLFSDGLCSFTDKTAVSSNFPNIYEISSKRQHNWLGIFDTIRRFKKSNKSKTRKHYDRYTSTNYDAVARALHWLTVLGFIGILSTITVWTIYDGEEWVKSLFGVHKSIGFITLLVIIVRIVWALLNASKRPAADSFAAKAGHLALYVFMLAVPVIGMIRQYGGGRGPLKVFGVEVMQGSPEKIEWMSNLGNMAHGKLGWLLFALVAGHIAMVVVHRIQGHDVLYRMIGRRS